MFDINLETLLVIAALIIFVILFLIGVGVMVYLAKQPAPPLGYFEGETCNREGCKGEIYDEARADGESCFCNVTSMPPCSFCECPHEVCDACGWQARDEY